MNPNTSLPTPETLAEIQRQKATQLDHTLLLWEELSDHTKSLLVKGIQAVLDHLKPWLKGLTGCPVEPPAGYVAMRGRHVTNPVPQDTLFGGLDRTAPWKWVPAWGIGSSNVPAGDLDAWYATPATKESQPPDWITNLLKAMECAECPTFLNVVAQIKELEKELAEAQIKFGRDVEDARQFREDEQSLIADFQTKLAATEKRVAELEWRPVSVKPTREDADAAGDIVVTNGQGVWDYDHTESFLPTITHWRPAALPKQPTPEDHRREVFEKAFMGTYDSLKDFSGEYVSAETRQAWLIWQRAIVETERKEKT